MTLGLEILLISVLVVMAASLGAWFGHCANENDPVLQKIKKDHKNKETNDEA